MKLLTRLVWTTSDGAQELISLDSRIKVHAYEVSPSQLGQLMRAGLVCLRELSALEQSPLCDEAQRTLLEWNRFLPAAARSRPAVLDLPDRDPEPTEPAPSGKAASETEAA